MGNELGAWSDGCFWKSKADVYVHVSFGSDEAWVFRADDMKSVIREHLELKRHTSPTSQGYLVPHSLLPRLRTFRLTDDMLKHAPHDNAREDVKGRAAETVAKMLLKPDDREVPKRENIDGTDFWHRGRRIQVKHDYRAGHTLNFYVETKERNPRRLRS